MENYNKIKLIPVITYYNASLDKLKIYKENENRKLKYGYLSFSLDILEYCEPNLLINRKQYYIDLMEP